MLLAPHRLVIKGKADGTLCLRVPLGLSQSSAYVGTRPGCVLILDALGQRPPPLPLLNLICQKGYTLTLPSAYPPSPSTPLPSEIPALPALCPYSQGDPVLTEGRATRPSKWLC